MSFKPGPSKRAQEVIFSQKVNWPTYSPLVFNYSSVTQAYCQMHLGKIEKVSAEVKSQ